MYCIHIHRVDMWLFWCVFFFGLAWWMNHYYRPYFERLYYCAPGGLCCPCLAPINRDQVNNYDSDDEEEKDKLLNRLISTN